MYWHHFNFAKNWEYYKDYVDTDKDDPVGPGKKSLWWVMRQRLFHNLSLTLVMRIWRVERWLWSLKGRFPRRSMTTSLCCRHRLICRYPVAFRRCQSQSLTGYRICWLAKCVYNDMHIGNKIYIYTLKYQQEISLPNTNVDLYSHSYVICGFRLYTTQTTVQHKFWLCVYIQRST